MRRFLNNRISNYNNVGDKVDDFCEDCENRWLPFSRVWWDSTEKNIANIKRKDNGIFVIKKILSLINSISESIKDIYDRINVIEPPTFSEDKIELVNNYIEVGVTEDDFQEDLNIALYENYINLKNTKVDTVNSKEPDENKNVDLGLQDVMEVNRLINNMIQMESGGGLMLETNNEGLFGKRFFAYTSSEDPNIFRLGTGIYQPTGDWAAATFFGFGAMNSLLRENTTSQVSGIVAIGYNSLKGFERGINGGITAVGTETLLKFKGEPEILLARSHFMTALGVNALSDFLNGSRNTALGGSSGRRLVTGSNNTFTGAASMQDLIEGSNNTAIGYQVTATLKKGSNNTFIGANLQLGEEEVNDTVIIADGTSKQHFKSDDKGSILPYQTIALIDADETGKAIITKEFVDSKISNFKLPTNWESPQQRFSGLVDKSADATYNKVMVLDSEGKAGMKDVNEAYLNPNTLINILKSATIEQIITIREILYTQVQ